MNATYTHTYPYTQLSTPIHTQTHSHTNTLVFTLKLIYAQECVHICTRITISYMPANTNACANTHYTQNAYAFSTNAY